MSRLQIMNLKDKLFKITNGSASISKFLQICKSIMYDLVIINIFIGGNDLIIYRFNTKFESYLITVKDFFKNKYKKLRTPT